MKKEDADPDALTIIFLAHFLKKNITLVIGGSSGGAQGRAPPPLGQIFFIFMQFLGKIGQIVCWRPPLWGWRPPVWEILDPPLLVSGKGEEWKTDDVANDIVLLYKGDNKYSPIDVGTYQFKYKILIFWLRQLIFFSSAHKLSCTAIYI